MHAMPSVIPLSPTASITSSVMSRTASPPAVRSSVSRWKTFTAFQPSSVVRATASPILRVRAGYVTGEPSVAGGAARGGRAARIRGRATAGGSPDADRPGHPLALVAVDRAVHLVRAAGLEGVLDGLVGAGLDVAALDFVSAAARLDREGVGDLALVGDLEGVGAGLRQGD